MRVSRSLRQAFYHGTLSTTITRLISAAAVGKNIDAVCVREEEKGREKAAWWGRNADAETLASLPPPRATRNDKIKRNEFSFLLYSNLRLLDGKDRLSVFTLLKERTGRQRRDG